MKGIMRKSTAAKRKLAAIVLCTMLLVNIFSAAVEDNPAIITLDYDGVEYTYATHASTIEEFLTIEGIQVKDNDYMSHDKTAAIEDGMKIAVNVAKYVTVDDEGKVCSSVTYQTTVAGVLKEFNVPALEGHDNAYPAADERIYDGSVILVSRAKLVTFTNEGYALQYYSFSRTVGEFIDEMGFVCDEDKKIVPEESSALVDGMTVAVRNNVEAMSPLDFGIDLSTARVITCEATAYTPSADECGKSDGITATGAKCEVGVVAVDPRVIPLGTKLYIETVDGSFVYGYCSAQDTGGAIKGNKVDLAMNTKSECFQFGRRKVKVYILPA